MSFRLDQRASASDAFADWVNEQDQLEAIYLSAVTIHEIEKCVRLLETKGTKAKAAGFTCGCKA
ncbi:PIN domain-containing protein [Rhizobium mongolense]|uniref:Uncharacterized protein n=1 Tax=Rhizobium mongolense TaxID=57676 RepID=A0ABR6IWQ0_9HYPH|nr:hypothetical protein [Rhizobium mongolense]MBB4232344.1 hypothetical protein [Rhizobium mongolense]